MHACIYALRHHDQALLMRLVGAWAAVADLADARRRQAADDFFGAKGTRRAMVLLRPQTC